MKEILPKVLSFSRDFVVLRNEKATRIIADIVGHCEDLADSLELRNTTPDRHKAKHHFFEWCRQNKRK